MQLSGDGNKLVASSFGPGPYGNQPFNTFIYEWSDRSSSWLEPGTLIATQDAGLNPSRYVAMSDDGSTVGVRTISSPSAYNELSVYTQTPSLCIEADIKVNLEGPSASGGMHSKLANREIIPEQEPYTLAGYVFPAGSGGGETSTTAVFKDEKVVDWVAIEVRDTNSDLIWAKSALLKSDGQIVDVDGVSQPLLPDFLADGQLYYLGVHHRNHLDVKALDPLLVSNNTVTVDFTDPAISSTIQKTLKSGKNALIAGDATGDNCINRKDRKKINKDKKLTGYWNSDVDMQGKVNNKDRKLAKKNNKQCLTTSG